jgi:hypothetical protein
VLPAESVTPDVVALPALHTPASTIRRFPLAMLDVGVSVRFAVAARLLTCWTKASVVGGAGHGRHRVGSPPNCPLVPTALVALTLKV